MFIKSYSEQYVTAKTKGFVVFTGGKMVSGIEGEAETPWKGMDGSWHCKSWEMMPRVPGTSRLLPQLVFRNVLAIDSIICSLLWANYIQEIKQIGRYSRIREKWDLSWALALGTTQAEQLQQAASLNQSEAKVQTGQSTISYSMWARHNVYKDTAHLLIQEQRWPRVRGWVIGWKFLKLRSPCLQSS